MNLPSKGRFHLHYGRWIRLPEDIPAEKLLLQVRTSPLLLCSILLIAVRHTTDQLTERLAPRLFDQVKRLLGSELLVVPQHTQFFQATIVLSLWSTTIGHAPLSIDGWAITSYAIQQTLASPLFIDAVGVSPASLTYQDTRYLWNHLVLAHLQYVQTNRPRTFPPFLSSLTSWFSNSLFFWL